MMAARLLNTKLVIPPVRRDRVIRSRLLEQMNNILQPGVRLALISAPPGFGKTTLLAEWMAGYSKAAWLTVDAHDNSVETFLVYIINAVERIQPGLISETAIVLQAGEAGHDIPSIQIILSNLVEDLYALDHNQPVVLALDDFQFITSVEIRDAVRFLVENLPPGLRLAIATRSDPPIPLARLRASGQMIEIRASDLGFTQNEAFDFFIQTMHINLDPAISHEVVSAIVNRTEGWAAGLQMAALAIQSTPSANPIELVSTFSGANRYILDYLIEEVLDHLPEETVAFLLRTSILDRFCAELCEALIDPLDQDIPDSPAYQPRTASRQILETLERANLFLIALDNDRRWFRYHHLFTDLLRARLKQTRPELLPRYQRRAGVWFERQGLFPDAIRYTLKAAENGGGEADYIHAAELVEQNCISLLGSGELHAVLDWLELLPENLTCQRPWLCIYKAWTLLMRGNIQPVEALLQSAETDAAALSMDDREHLLGHCAAIRCHANLLTGNLDLVFEMADQAAQKLLETDHFPLGISAWSAGYAARSLGQLEKAIQNFKKLFINDVKLGNVWGAGMSATELGLTLRSQGHIREAIKAYRDGLSFIHSRQKHYHGYTARLLTALAGALYEINHLEEARQLLIEAVSLTEQWQNPNHQVYAYTNLARLHTACGEYEAANQALDLADQQVHTLPVISVLARSVETNRALLQFAMKELVITPNALETAIQEALSTPQLPYEESQQMRESLLARIAISMQHGAEAMTLLHRIEQTARETERVCLLVETLTLESLAWFIDGIAGKALATLEEAVKLATPEGMIRSIVDQETLAPGALVQILDALKRRSFSSTRDYIDHLLVILPARQSEAAVEKPARSSFLFVEPLSERELEVVVLLAEGLTNPQIASRLVISPGTVKAHTANIFRKLDATNRTQAVTRARELGLVK